MKKSIGITLILSSVSLTQCSNRESSGTKTEGATKAASTAVAAPAKSAEKKVRPSDPASPPPGAISADLPALPLAGSATEAVFAARSPECQECARSLVAGCDLSSLGCETLPAGKSREQCLETLRCVLPSGSRPSCVDKTNSNLTACYCGSATVENCLAGKGEGACKKVLETTLGSKDPGVVARTITDTSLPGGLAMKLVQCVADVGRLADAKCRSCF